MPRGTSSVTRPTKVWRNGTATAISTQVKSSTLSKNAHTHMNDYYSIKNMLLRGCFLRNIEYCVGLVVSVGPESKIMKNAKAAPKKVSNIMT